MTGTWKKLRKIQRFGVLEKTKGRYNKLGKNRNLEYGKTVQSRNLVYCRNLTYNRDFAI